MGGGEHPEIGPGDDGGTEGLKPWHHAGDNLVLVRREDLANLVPQACAFSNTATGQGLAVLSGHSQRVCAVLRTQGTQRRLRLMVWQAIFTRFQTLLMILSRHRHSGNVCFAGPLMAMLRCHRNVAWHNPVCGRDNMPRVLTQLPASAVVPGDDDGDDMHPRSKATRRGPMDEMRQLVRSNSCRSTRMHPTAGCRLC